MGKLDDKVAIVTGARDGIGRAVAKAFAKEGAKLVLTSRSISDDSDVVREVSELGAEALVFRCDVGFGGEVQQLIKAALDRFGRIDVLVNNAGITRPAMVYKMTEEQWDEVIRVHLKGAFNCIRWTVPHMMERNSGAIINVTSSAGLVGTIGQVNYSAAKAGIVGLTKSCARELAKYNIRVNAISPFAVTEMTKTITTDPKFKEIYLSRIPMGRFGEPEEIAPAVVFLASDDARYITGQVLCVDGGQVM